MARTFKGGRGNQVKDVDTREALITIEDGLREMSDSIAQISRGNIPTGGGALGTLGVTDHGALTGLGDDDHSQYLLLAGRAGGQTVRGSTTTTTQNTTKLTLYASGNDEVKAELGWSAKGPALTLTAPNSGTVYWAPNFIATDGTSSLSCGLYNSLLSAPTETVPQIYSYHPTKPLEIGAYQSSVLFIRGSDSTALPLVQMLTYGSPQTALLWGQTTGLVTTVHGGTTTSGDLYVGSARSYRFLNNAGSAYLSALSKDTSDRLIVGETNISTIYEKPAGSTVGTWTNTGLAVTGTVSATTFSGSGASLTSIPESAITDGTIFPRLAAAETVTNVWTFDGDVGSWVAARNSDQANLPFLALVDGASGGSLYCFLDANVGVSDVNMYFPATGGTVVSTTASQLLSGKTLAVDTGFRASTSSSGANFFDTTTTTKKLRVVLSGSVGNNSLTLTNTAARNYTLRDHAGGVVVCGTTTSASGVLGIEDLTAQTGNITAKTLLTSSSNSSGMFRVSFYVKTTTAGSGGDIVTVTVAYNDGSAQTADVPLTVAAAGATTTAFTHDLATLNKASFGEVLVYCAASNAITFTTTVTKTGSPQYTVRARIEQLA